MNGFALYPTHGIAKPSGCPCRRRNLYDQPHYETERPGGSACGFTKWYDVDVGC